MAFRSFLGAWYSDKKEVQNELAGSLASMLHVIHRESQPCYLKAFWKIIAMERAGIDRLRLNKFYFLLKHFVVHTAKSMEYLRSSEALGTLSASTPGTEVPLAIEVHISETDWLSRSAMFNAITIYFVGIISISCLLATKPSNWMIKSIKSGIFRVLLIFLMTSTIRSHLSLMQIE
jgi:hypothetical protein